LPEIEDLEKKWNCKIDFPSTEQASDVVTISGPEYQVPQAVDAFLGMVPENHEISFQKADGLETFFTSTEFDNDLRQKLRSQYEVDVHVNPQVNSLPKSATASVERIVSASEGRLVLTYTRNNAGGLKDAIDFLISQLVPHGLNATSIKGAIPRPISDSFEDCYPFLSPSCCKTQLQSTQTLPRARISMATALRCLNELLCSTDFASQAVLAPSPPL